MCTSSTQILVSQYHSPPKGTTTPWRSGSFHGWGKEVIVKPGISYCAKKWRNAPKLMEEVWKNFKGLLNMSLPLYLKGNSICMKGNSLSFPLNLLLYFSSRHSSPPMQEIRVISFSLFHTCEGFSWYHDKNIYIFFSYLLGLIDLKSPDQFRALLTDILVNKKKY